ncbi:MAG: DedA family protein [Bacteroidia bacterium]
MWDFLKQLTDPESIIQYGGLWLLLVVIFAETGLLIGFFLPGDNLILLSGILCNSEPELLNVDFITLVVLMFLAAVLGNIFGYLFGKISGEKLYSRKESIFFKKRHLETTKSYFDRFGGYNTLIIARFIPIIRTFAPIICGAIKVSFLKFMIYNLIGGFLWIVSLSSIGYYLIELFPGIKNYLGYIFIAIIIITAIPILRIVFKNINKPT